MKRRLSSLLALAGIAMALPFSTQAEIKMPVVFTDNMVLQRGASVPVWGWANDGETVTVQFAGQRVSTKAKNGKWMVELKSMRANATPSRMTIDGRNRIELNNILVGEVWLCSGQSNMAWTMLKSDDPQAEIANSANPMLRLFTVQRKKSDTPLEDLDMPWNTGVYGWQEASNQSVPDFSAVAYYFGKKLQKDLGVPVGLIHSSWGGSPAEAWTSNETLSSNKNYREDILDNYYLQLARHKKALAEGKKSRAPWQPSELYNGMINALVPYAIKGAIWYQGESNAGRAYQYRSLFPDMIKDWQKKWKQSDFTFLAVQLAPWDRNQKRSMEEITAKPVESGWAELREAQLMAAKSPKNGMVVITDHGTKDDIHPPVKKPVGERLVLAARGIAYKEKITYSGPIFKTMKVKKEKSGTYKAILSFDHVGKGLEAKGGKLTGFAVCGADQNFVWADAEIDGDTIVVSSPEVTKPVAVRFGWADYPVVNLFNKDGLPASPFRTDKFKGITE